MMKSSGCSCQSNSQRQGYTRVAVVLRTPITKPWLDNLIAHHPITWQYLSRSPYENVTRGLWIANDQYCGWSANKLIDGVRRNKNAFDNLMLIFQHLEPLIGVLLGMGFAQVYCAWLVCLFCFVKSWFFVIDNLNMCMSVLLSNYADRITGILSDKLCFISVCWAQWTARAGSFEGMLTEYFASGLSVWCVGVAFIFD